MAHRNVIGLGAFVNLHYDAKAVSAYVIDGRGRGLFRIASDVTLPNAFWANVEQVGPMIPNLNWSGQASWRAGRLPVLDAGEFRGGPIFSSWNGSDRNKGELRSSAFPVPTNGCVIFPVLHGPRVDGLSVTLMDADSGAVTAEAPMEDEDTKWNFWRMEVPAPTHRLRIVASDQGTGWGEWVAIANPDECR